MLNMLKRPAARNSVGSDIPLLNSLLLSDRAKAEAWLQDKLLEAERAAKPVVHVVTLTPALAELLLSFNLDNRTLKPDRLRDYESDIKAGRWVLNGETLKVSREGCLNDGQHRCTAVINTQTSIETQIGFGYARESRTTLDQGAARTPGDYLTMSGVQNANVAAAVSASIWQYTKRNQVSHQTLYRPTKQQIQETFHQYRDEITAAIGQVKKKGSLMAGGPSTLAFCLFVFAQVSSLEEATFFIQKLIRGDGLTSRDPIYVCRERIHANKRMKLEEKVELIFRAWNAHRSKRSVKSLQVLGGPLPTPHP